MEVYGEDPTTIAKLGHAYITGMQHGDVGAPSTPILLVAASPKHFTGMRNPLKHTPFPLLKQPLPSFHSQVGKKG